MMLKITDIVHNMPLIAFTAALAVKNMRSSSKVHPIMEASQHLEIGEYVMINNPTDDMHGMKGTFNGHYKHVDGIVKSWIVLDDGRKNFYTEPSTLRRCIDWYDCVVSKRLD